MGILDGPLMNAVSTVFTKIGGTCVLKLSSRAGYDPLTGDKEPVAAQQWTVPCSPEQPLTKRSLQKHLADGKAIVQETFMLTIPAKGLVVTPTIHMSVQRRGRWYSIIAVEPINSGDALVAYNLHCEG